MTTPQPHDVAQDLRRSLGRLVRTLRRHDEDDLSPTTAAILLTVSRDGPLTLGELATIERLAKPSVTAAVDKLTTAGLLERRPDRDDRRIAWVTITPAGRRRIDVRSARRTAWLASRLQALDADELAVLARAAEILDGVTAPEKVTAR
jgi:DNA-binding MarR family transcriptional regulator